MKVTVKDIFLNILFLSAVALVIFDKPPEGVLYADFGISAIIAAIIAATATTAAGVASNRAQKKAGEQSLELAGIARSDTLKEQAIQTGLKKRQLKLNENQFSYEKMMNREVANKSSIANLGTSLSMLSKNGVDMQQFISSLYGKSTPTRMG
jgi:hypothetical protein